MGNNISFIQPRDAWDKLSIPEKAEMMKVAVSHGIYNLNDIRQKYNEFALGGDTEEASVSPNEAARMGAMVGAAIAARPKGYIGGSTSEARQKYWKTDNEMRMLTDSVANQYSISPNLLRTRMDNEGYTDARINEINKDIKEGTNRALMGTALFNSEALPYVAGSEFGLDDVATYINNGTVNLINENWGDGQFQNEKGRWTRMAMGHNYSDNIGIMAATLKALKDIARKDFPNASDADLDRYASAYYNRGIKGGREWVKRGAKGYKVNKHSTGGNLFDGIIEESQQMQISPYRYVLDDEGKWNRVTNDEEGRMFQGLTVTPKKTKRTFVPARMDNSFETLKKRDVFFQQRDRDGNLKGESGLGLVYPEFELLLGVRPFIPSYSRQAINEYKIGRAFNSSLKPKKINDVNNAFRQTEWDDFLLTRNGDNYYKLTKAPERGGRVPNQNYFLSHTTPWEEGTSLRGGVQDQYDGFLGATQNKRPYLYEFPTESSFKKLPSTNADGIYQSYEVTDMGRNHLLYGNHTSRQVGPVKYFSDLDELIDGPYPVKFGNIERPYVNGLYDRLPIYEDYRMGYQTVVPGSELNDVIQNTSYNIFDFLPSPFERSHIYTGIGKTIYVPK